MSSHGSLFDIMGPVMVGPSSSHTAGAVRLALLARNVAQAPIQSAEFVLYNSFAKTYQGHGTDKGLLAGLLGIQVEDPAIRTIFEHPLAQTIDYWFTPFQESNHYPPNTVRFELALANGEHLSLVGHSLGGGKVHLSKINDYTVSLKGEYPTLILFYADQPGMIWQTTKVIAEAGINIATLTCTRADKGKEAFMAICLDSLLPPESVAAIRQIGGVYSVRNVDKVPSLADKEIPPHEPVSHI